jgi:hypothetical protein
MNKKRSIFLLCALILLFGTGYYILQHAETAPGEQADVPALPVPQTVQSIEISYGQEDFRIIQHADGWKLASDADFPLDTPQCTALQNALTSLQAAREVEGGDYKAFGFEEPLCRICAVDSDGTEYNYILGNRNDYNGLYYLSCGDETVYMLDAAAAELFFIGSYDLINADKAPDIDEDRVCSLSVQSASGIWNYTLERTETDGSTGYQISGSMLDPNAPEHRRPADPDSSVALIQDITLLYLYSCVEYRADDAQKLALYGLSEPAAQATIVYEQEDENGQAQRLSFRYDFGSQTEDGYIYVRMEGSDMIFLAYYNEAAQFLSPDFAALLKTEDAE